MSNGRAPEPRPVAVCPQFGTVSCNQILTKVAQANGIRPQLPPEPWLMYQPLICRPEIATTLGRS